MSNIVELEPLLNSANLPADPREFDFQAQVLGLFQDPKVAVEAAVEEVREESEAVSQVIYLDKGGKQITDQELISLLEEASSQGVDVTNSKELQGYLDQNLPKTNFAESLLAKFTTRFLR